MFSRKATGTFEKLTHTNMNLEKIDKDLTLSRNQDAPDEPYKSSRIVEEDNRVMKNMKRNGLFNTISIRKGF